MSQYQQPPQNIGQSTQNQPAGTVETGQQGIVQQISPQMGQQEIRFPTSSHLPEQVRSEVIRELNQILADSTILLTQARFAHWNVKGMAFYGLHALFEEVGEMFENQVDLVAERITALGGQALGTASIAVQNGRIPTMPTNVVTGQEFVQVLAERLAVHDANLRQALSAVTEWDDLDTADLLNEISREVSQALWFLDAHLQTQPITAGGVGTQQGGQQIASQQQMIQQ
jgi:starvation-inducible DNA-binding protein